MKELKELMELNDFSGLTDQDILNLTQEEFEKISGWESFKARLFIMDDIKGIKEFIKPQDMFGLVYFWYSTDLGLSLEEKYVKDLSIDLYKRVWQELGQYVGCGWLALKRAQKEGNSGRMSNMGGWPRLMGIKESNEIIDEIARRINIIRENMGSDYENFK